jgi:hypothetical protein
MKRAAFSDEKPLEKITSGYTFNHDKKNGWCVAIPAASQVETVS